MPCVPKDILLGINSYGYVYSEKPITRPPLAVSFAYSMKQSQFSFKLPHAERPPEAKRVDASKPHAVLLDRKTCPGRSMKTSIITKSVST